MQAALPSNEVERLRALNAYRVLDTPPEQAYDDITRLAAYICNTPIALVSLIDESRQWFKSKVGMEITETPREVAFCAHALLHPQEMLLVNDATRDPRFSDNPAVQDAPHVRFYAGVPLVTETGEAVGTLCVIDYQTRQLDAAAQAALSSLARQVMAQLELRKSLYMLRQNESELKRINQVLTEQALTDPLTQVHNRRSLEHSLIGEWERAFRYSQPLSVLMLDVDEFKSYNDTFGHQAGDGVLRQVAEILRREARQPDIVARYGGEEFVIILPETDSEGALKIADRVRYKIETARWPHRAVTISVGVASYGNQADADALLMQADQALYRAKQAGRNCVMSAI